MKSQKDDNDKPKARPVFFDPTSHRLVFFSVLSGVFFVFAVVWFVSFMVHLHRSELPPHDGNVALGEVEVVETGGSPSVAEAEGEGATASPSQLWTDAIENALPPDEPYAVQEANVHAFVPSWSLAGVVEARTNIKAIDVLLTDGVTIDGATGKVTQHPSSQRDKLLDLWSANKDRVSFFPIAQIELSQAGGQPNVFSSAALQSELIAALSAAAVSENANGLCVDLSGASNVAVQDV